MFPAVRPIFRDITRDLEADIPHIYRDPIGIPTVGAGRRVDNGVEPTAECLRMPFRWRDGRPGWASEAEIRADYKRVLAAPAGWRNSAAVAQLELAQADRDDILWWTLDEFEARLKAQFAEWESWPADAQLATLSHAWNMGTNLTGTWPRMSAGLLARDFLTAAAQCTPGAGPTARSRQNVIMYTHAASVEPCKREPGVIRYGAQIISVASLSWAVRNPTGIGVVAWYVQRQLSLLGLYAGPLDGRFGPMSRAAYSRFVTARALPDEVTVPVLTRLGKDSGLVLPVTG